MSATTLIMLFVSTTQTFHLPVGLHSALCYVESNHRTHVIHKDDGNGNSVGVCQIKPETAKLLGYKGTEKGLLDPKTNIYYSAKYLRHQLTRYSGDTVKAIAAYNAGTYKLNKKGLIMNQTYVDKVLKAWKKHK